MPRKKNEYAFQTGDGVLHRAHVAALANTAPSPSETATKARSLNEVNVSELARPSWRSTIR